MQHIALGLAPGLALAFPAPALHAQQGGGQPRSQAGTKAGKVMDSRQAPGRGPQSKQLKSGAAGNEAAAAYKVETRTK
jgi:hypothetical protein